MHSSFLSSLPLLYAIATVTGAIQAYTISSTEMHLSQLKAQLDCVDLALFQNRTTLGPGEYVQHCNNRHQVNLLAADLFLTELFAELHLNGGTISEGRTLHAFMGVYENPEQYLLPNASTTAQRQTTRHTDRWDNPNRPAQVQSAPCTPPRPRTPKSHRRWRRKVQSSPINSPSTPTRGNRYHPYTPSLSPTWKPKNACP